LIDEMAKSLAAVLSAEAKPLPTGSEAFAMPESLWLEFITSDSKAFLAWKAFDCAAGNLPHCFHILWSGLCIQLLRARLLLLASVFSWLMRWMPLALVAANRPS
jgi:hypothetical protein